MEKNIDAYSNFPRTKERERLRKMKTSSTPTVHSHFLRREGKNNGDDDVQKVLISWVGIKIPDFFILFLVLGRERGGECVGCLDGAPLPPRKLLSFWHRRLHLLSVFGASPPSKRAWKLASARFLFLFLFFFHFATYPTSFSSASFPYFLLLTQS